MEFKRIQQPEFEYLFRCYHKADDRVYDVIGFDADEVIVICDGAEVRFRRDECEIDQWTGLLDQEKREIFTNDVVEVFNSCGRPVGLFIVRYNSLEGRYVLDGVTRGAHISRLTRWQNVRIVESVYDEKHGLGRYMRNHTSEEK